MDVITYRVAWSCTDLRLALREMAPGGRITLQLHSFQFACARNNTLIKALVLPSNEWWIGWPCPSPTSLAQTLE
jgi:hypothetical protein